MNILKTLKIYLIYIVIWATFLATKNLFAIEIMSLVSIFIVFKYKHIKLKEIYSYKFPSKRNFIYSVLIAILTIAVFPEIKILVNYSKFQNIIHSINLSNVLNKFTIYNFCIAIIIAPLCEEIIFRGTLFGYLYNETKKDNPIILLILAFMSSFCFMIWHFSINRYDAFFIGICFCYMYVWTKSIWTTILAHAVYNFFTESCLIDYIIIKLAYFWGNNLKMVISISVVIKIIIILIILIDIRKHYVK